jgi:hypothetical protein
MSILVMSQVWAYSRADGSTLLCALAIADFANDDGVAFPSVPTLAKKCRISDRSVQYALSKLIELNELIIDREQGPHGTNLYRLLVQNMRGAKSAPVQSTTKGGEAGCTQTVIEPSEEEEGEGRRQKPDRRISRVQPTVHAETGSIELMVDAALMAEWGKAFPAVDVRQAVARATGWLNANPANRKSNYERFLFNWLTREQDRAPRMATPQSATIPPRPAATAGFSSGRRPVHESWLNLGRPPQENHDDRIIDITPGTVT